MGVPKFFRWVTSRYPITLSEELPSDRNGGHGKNRAVIPPVDNLYLDMNGIIHACSHNDKSALLPAAAFETIVEDICKYVDNLIELLQPLQLLYIAVDGVAPRAKLNQQRARRYRASHDVKHMILSSKSKPEISTLFDSNFITPGTDFMTRLSIALKLYVMRRMQENYFWSRLQVYFSGSEVPGEGEHKVGASLK
jgi:5'-3' exonuclease